MQIWINSFLLLRKAVLLAVLIIILYLDICNIFLRRAIFMTNKLIFFPSRFEHEQMVLFQYLLKDSLYVIHSRTKAMNLASYNWKRKITICFLVYISISALLETILFSFVAFLGLYGLHRTWMRILVCIVFRRSSRWPKDEWI